MSSVKKKKKASRHAENPESTLYFVSPVGFLSLHFRSLSFIYLPVAFSLHSSRFVSVSPCFSARLSRVDDANIPLGRKHTELLF